VRLGDRIFLLSPRPARLLHAVPIDVPRAQRTLATIAKIKAKLAGLDPSVP
jgi:NitT/TauT family transport system ATP-binding protein